jgi:hypothetical protein
VTRHITLTLCKRSLHDPGNINYVSDKFEVFFVYVLFNDFTLENSKTQFLSRNKIANFLPRFLNDENDAVILKMRVVLSQMTRK